MEFGVFAQLFVPRFERDVDPDAEHKRIIRNVEIRRRRAQRAQVRVVPAAPLPRRVLAHARARGVPLATAPRITERIHLGSAIFNITPPVNKPARIAENVALLDHLLEQPLRVRHRPRLVDHRGVRLRHRRHRRHQGDVARDDHRDPEDVEGRARTLRGQVLPHARARGVPEAARPVAPGDVGGGAARPRPSPRRASSASARSASPRARHATSSRS